MHLLFEFSCCIGADCDGMVLYDCCRYLLVNQCWLNGFQVGFAMLVENWGGCHFCGGLPWGVMLMH